MNQKLKEAAGSGDIDSLYSIIQEDAYILDCIDQVPFVDTPLHLSAAAGHVHFSMEIMRLKPSFAKKLNPEGYTPMHLALQNDQTDVVFRLMDIDRDLVSVKGREGLTPLHMVAFGGKTDILFKFLVSCPTSIKELTIYKESALHIAVKNGDVDSLKILLEWVQQTGLTTVLNWANDRGNNIMHLAALGDQIEMSKLLIKKKVDMMSKNDEGLTALDIMEERDLGDSELRKMLTKPRFALRTLKHLASFFRKIMSIFKICTSHPQKYCHPEKVNMSKEDRNTILVVSVLIATATYQALLSPPDKDFLKNLENSTFNPIITARMLVIVLFRCLNTIAFLSSMMEIVLHLPSGIGYTLHLVLPLVICYALLLFFGWTIFTPVTFGLLLVSVFFFVGLKVPIITQKICGGQNSLQS